MKWIGQHIWDFISRFRNHVYFEDNVTLSTGKSITMDEYTSGTISITKIQDSGTSFNDNDTSIMTAAAIADKIEGYGYSTTSGDITGVTITTDSGGGSTASDTAGSADFSILGATGVGVTNSGTTITATAVPGEIDHDSLQNFEDDEHYTQANIVATGTIASGVWQGTAIASAYLDADTVHLSVDQEITSKTQINKRKFSNVTGSTGDCEGDIIYLGTDAASHVAGNIYTLNSSSQWVITDADATATSTGLLAVAMGTDANSGMCIRGMVNLNTTFSGSPSTGDVLYLDNATAGAATGTAPTGNGDIVRVLGYKIGSGTRMWFNPDNTFVEVTA